MTPEQIRAERTRLLREAHKVEKHFRKAMEVINKQLRDLEKACPHPPEAAGSASYSRWCNNCGWGRDCS